MRSHFEIVRSTSRSEPAVTRGGVRSRRQRNVQRLRRLMVGATVALGSFASFGMTQAGATGSVTSYYLALGGSGSLGVQPTVDHPNGQPTNSGYANDLLALERSRGAASSLLNSDVPAKRLDPFSPEAITADLLACPNWLKPSRFSSRTRA